VTSHGRQAGGVRAIRLTGDDEVIGCHAVETDRCLLVASANGYGKRTSVRAYPAQGRGGKGVKTMNCTPKTGVVVGSEIVEDDDILLLITENGKGIRLRVKEVRTTGRIAQGVRLVNVASGDRVANVTKVIAQPENLEESEEE
jgi:DNA gyrase subunit A